MFCDRCASSAPFGSSTTVLLSLPLIPVFLMSIFFYSGLSFCDATYTSVQILCITYDRCAWTHHLSAAHLFRSISGCWILFQKELDREICECVHSGSETTTFPHLRTSLHISKIFPEHLALEVTFPILRLRLCFYHRHFVSPVRAFTSDGVIFLVFQLSFADARRSNWSFERAIVASREF